MGKPCPVSQMLCVLGGERLRGGVPVAPICGNRNQERIYCIPKAHILGRFPHPDTISPSLLPTQNWSFLFSCLPSGSIFPFSQGMSGG